MLGQVSSKSLGEMVLCCFPRSQCFQNVKRLHCVNIGGKWKISDWEIKTCYWIMFVFFSMLFFIPRLMSPASPAAGNRRTLVECYSISWWPLFVQDFSQRRGKWTIVNFIFKAGVTRENKAFCTPCHFSWRMANPLFWGSEYCRVDEIISLGCCCL